MIINVENDTMLGRNNDSIYATKFYVMQKQIDKLQQENKQLKDNWNKLKKAAKNHSDIKKKCYNGELWFEIDDLLNKMIELEESDSNVKD